MVRRGTVREDGKVFWAYKLRKNKKYEQWITREKFEQYDGVRIKRYKLLKEKYQESQDKLPPDQRNFLGRCDPETGLYFIRLQTNGKPKFGTLEELENYKKNRRRLQRECYAKIKSITPPPSVCLGDKHPTDPNLVVVEIRSHKVKYGPIEKLQKRREKIKQSSVIYRQLNGKKIVDKYREIRQKKLQERKKNLNLKFRRGDIDPITKWKFWGYSALGNEIWIHPDEFVERRTVFNKKRLDHYYAKRAAMGFTKKSGD